LAIIERALAEARQTIEGLPRSAEARQLQARLSLLEREWLSGDVLPPGPARRAAMVKNVLELTLQGMRARREVAAE
jgi:hypothetical protein